MPFYNYNCKECGHDDGEKLAKNFDEIKLCPLCNAPMEKGLNNPCNFQIDPAVPRGM